MQYWWNDNDRGKLKYLEKNLPQCANLSTTKHMDWLGVNLGLHDKRLTTSYLSHGTADSFLFWSPIKRKALPCILYTPLPIFHTPLQCMPSGLGAISLLEKSGFSVEHN
jgi:hypothetical protein